MTYQAMPSRLGGRNAITQQALLWVSWVVQSALTQRARTFQVCLFWAIDQKAKPREAAVRKQA